MFRPLVAFDFDGTLTCRDSFLDFLAWRYGRLRCAAALPGLAPAALGYLRRRDRGRLKAAVVRALMTGETLDGLAAAAARFAGARGGDLLRPDALRCWREWRARDARLVIVTAAPQVLAAPFGKGLGAHAVIGTRLAASESGALTGALNGPNCRGPEKVARLRAAFGEDVRLEAAYGDTDGDTAMLAIADHPGMRVFSERP